MHLFPISFESAIYLILIWLLICSLSWLLILYKSMTRKLKVAVAWTFTVCAMVGVHLIFQYETAGFRMIALILILLQCMKLLVALFYRKHSFTPLQWLKYSILSVQMSPDYVFNQKTKSIEPWRHHVNTGGIHFIIGFGLIYVIRLIDFNPVEEGWVLTSLIGLVVLIGLSQILHFGLLRINTGMLHWLGYPAKVLFQKPLKSKSLRTFWGKRWNIAFTQMTQAIAYRPLSGYMNRRLAVILAFLFSGLLHEIAISFSVMECFGLPMLYFVIHAFAMTLEPILFAKKEPGRIWVLAFLIAPLPLLFHKAFMAAVVWPFVG